MIAPGPPSSFPQGPLSLEPAHLQLAQRLNFYNFQLRFRATVVSLAVSRFPALGGGPRSV
jgi:hypothetical protein